MRLAWSKIKNVYKFEDMACFLNFQPTDPVTHWNPCYCSSLPCPPPESGPLGENPGRSLRHLIQTDPNGKSTQDMTSDCLVETPSGHRLVSRMSTWARDQAWRVHSQPIGTHKRSSGLEKLKLYILYRQFSSPWAATPGPQGWVVGNAELIITVPSIMPSVRSEPLPFE